MINKRFPRQESQQHGDMVEEVMVEDIMAEEGEATTITMIKRKEKEMCFATQGQMAKGYYGTYTSVKEAICSKDTHLDDDYALGRLCNI